MAKKVAEKVIKSTDNLEQAASDFKGFVKRVKKEYPNVEVSIVVKAL